MPETRVLDDREALHRAAAEEFVRIVDGAIRRNDFAAVCLAGGTTPKGLYELLASDSFDDRLPWERIQFFFGDERWVLPTHPESNYRMAYQALFHPLGIPPWNTHRWATEIRDEIPVLLDHYDGLLQKYLRLGEGEPPRFDLVLLGMGTEGHTASLFPGSEALREKRAVAAPWIESMRSHRCTLTPPVFNNAANVLFLVSGAEKAATLHDVLEGPQQPDRLPAQMIQPGAGSLLWLVDRPAARLLAGAR
jgi:6-phosphogluconolactonase